MNPENTSNHLSSPSSSAGATGGGSSHNRYLPDMEGGGFALAQQMQYQQMLFQQQQHQLHQQQQQQQHLLHHQAMLQNPHLAGGIGGGSGGGIALSQRDPVREQIAAARQQALREAVLASQPYSSLHSAPSLLQHPLPPSSASSSSSFSSSGGAAVSVLAAHTQPSLLSLRAAGGGVVRRGSFPPLQHPAARQDPQSSSVMRMAAPTQSLSREESRLVEEAVLRGLPIEQVFREASSSTSQPGTSQLQHLSLGGGPPLSSSTPSSQLMMSMMDPAQVIAQRELLLATAAAGAVGGGSGGVGEPGGGVLRGSGSLLAATLGAAAKRSSLSDDPTDPAGKRKKKKPKRPSFASTASTGSASAIAPAGAATSSPRWLPGCAFPLPAARSASSANGKPDDPPRATVSSAPGADSASAAAATPAAAEGDVAVVHVGALTSYHKLWDRLGAYRRRKASLQLQPPGATVATSTNAAATNTADAVLRFQRELFRRKLASGAFPVEPSESRSAVLLYDRRQQQRGSTAATGTRGV